MSLLRRFRCSRSGEPLVCGFRLANQRRRGRGCTHTGERKPSAGITTSCRSLNELTMKDICPSTKVGWLSLQMAADPERFARIFRPRSRDVDPAFEVSSSAAHAALKKFGSRRESAQLPAPPPAAGTSTVPEEAAESFISDTSESDVVECNLTTSALFGALFQCQRSSSSQAEHRGGLCQNACRRMCDWLTPRSLAPLGSRR
eukprot:s6321_g3.t1